MWPASVSSAVVSRNDTYGAGRRAASDMRSAEIKFLRLTRLDGKKDDDVGRNVKDKMDSRREHLDKAPGGM